MTTKIGLSGSEATVKAPERDGRDRSTQHVGGSQRTANGTLIRHITATKRTWHETWRMLTAAQLSTLVTELVRQANLSWKPPEGSTYTVQVTEYTEKPEGRDRWTVTATLEEV